MAFYHGKEGSVKWDASVTRKDFDSIQSWSLSSSVDVAESTIMGDTWKSYLAGFKDWTATVTAINDSTGLDIGLATGDPNGLGDAPAKLELYIRYSASSPKYIVLYGSCICTGISPSLDKDGIGMATYTFQGTDTITWASSDALPSYA
jgi:hypothetical protein